MKKLLFIILAITTIVSCSKKYEPAPEPEPKPYRLVQRCTWFKADTVYAKDGSITIPRWVCTQFVTDTVWNNP